jgi:hypothetical protein
MNYFEVKINGKKILPTLYNNQYTFFDVMRQIHSTKKKLK